MHAKIWPSAANLQTNRIQSSIHVDGITCERAHSNVKQDDPTLVRLKSHFCSIEEIKNHLNFPTCWARQPGTPPWKKSSWFILNRRYIAAFVSAAFVRDSRGNCQTGTAKKRLSSPPRFLPVTRLAQRYMFRLVERKTCTPAYAYSHGKCSTQS